MKSISANFVRLPIFVACFLLERLRCNVTFSSLRLYLSCENLIFDFKIKIAFQKAKVKFYGKFAGVLEMFLYSINGTMNIRKNLAVSKISKTNLNKHKEYANYCVFNDIFNR